MLTLVTGFQHSLVLAVQFTMALKLINTGQRCELAKAGTIGKEPEMEQLITDIFFR